jgi:hypothetical protein
MRQFMMTVTALAAFGSMATAQAQTLSPAPDSLLFGLGHRCRLSETLQCNGAAAPVSASC